MPAACGQRQRPAADVPAPPGQVGVGAGVQQHRDDLQATSAGDRVVQAAVGVDVDATVEEPPQARGVLEVELVEDHLVEAGLVEQIEHRGVRLLAGVIEGVLVACGTTLGEQLDQRGIAMLDRVEQRRPAALAGPLDGVAVGVGTRIQQQLGAAAHVGRRAGRPSQQHQQRRQPVDRGAGLSLFAQMLQRWVRW